MTKGRYTSIGAGGTEHSTNISKMTKEEEKRRLSQMGDYLAYNRKKRGHSQVHVSTSIGDLSANYLSELESGKKVPSDETIRRLSNFYNIDEDDVFLLLNRVPLKAKEEVRHSAILRKLLCEVNDNKNLSQETKERIYESSYFFYKNVIELFSHQNQHKD